jgi:hypothetical protein
VSGDRFTEHYRLVSADPEKRAELLADPKAALAAYFGAVVDGEFRIEVIEQRSDTITAVVPAPPAREEDLAARLAEVSGRVYDMLYTTGIAGIPHSRRSAHLGASGYARTVGEWAGRSSRPLAGGVTA